VLVLLMIGLGFAGAIGWQNRDRWSALDAEISGIIQRDSLGIRESGVAGSGTASEAVPAELQQPQRVDQRGDTSGELPVPGGTDDPGPAAAGTDAGLAGNQTEAAGGGSGVAMSAESGQGVAAVTAEDDGQVEGYPESALRHSDEADLAVVQSEPVSPVVADAPPEGRVASATASGGVLAGDAAEEPTVETQPENPIEAERARLRREAEQRFRQELGRAEIPAEPKSAPTSSSVQTRADKTNNRSASQTTSVSAPVSESRQRDVTGRASSTPAPKESAGAVPVSRPKTASAPVAVASVSPEVVDVAPEPQRSPDQLRRILLQGQWTSQGKPASLLPSEITFCSAAGDKVKCWSVPQKTNTKYGKALYKIEATLYAFSAKGGFELSYRTLVKLVDSEETAEDPVLGGAGDDDTGWQVTERSMSCELSQSDRVLCSSATGTVRDYRRVLAKGNS